MSGASGRWVVLLRAVNVAGSVLPMATFRDALGSVGCGRVESVGAAGSAVVAPPARASPSALESAVEQALARPGGLSTEAFVRTEEAWQGIVAGNPFVAEADRDPAHLVVAVLKATPAAPAWTALRGAIVGRERVGPGDRHGYFVYPDGIGRSKLTIATIERKLGTRGTARNWNTVRRLAELAAA